MISILQSLKFHRVEVGDFMLVESVRTKRDTCVLSFVDIDAGTLGQLGESGFKQESIAPMLGFAEPLDNGIFLVGAGGRLGISVSGVSTHWTEPLLAEGQRFNDATIDCMGRLIVGTLSLREDTSSLDNCLFVLEKDGTLTAIRNQVGLSNGIAVDPHSGDLFHADTLRSTIHRIPLNQDSGSYGQAEMVHSFAANENPDGLILLQSGELLVALWGSGVLVAIDVNLGEVERSVVPPSFPTSVCICNRCGDLWLGSASEPRGSENLVKAPGALWKSSTAMRQFPAYDWDPVPIEIIRLGKAC